MGDLFIYYIHTKIERQRQQARMNSSAAPSLGSKYRFNIRHADVGGMVIQKRAITPATHAEHF